MLSPSAIHTPHATARQTHRRCWMLLVGSACILAGCVAAASAGPRPPTARPWNVYQAAATLPRDLQRVAILPLYTARTQLEPETRNQIEQALQAELLRSSFAEVVPLPPQTLRRLTGRTAWAADEPLPPDFLAKIRTETAADAVLFAELTAFRPYRPVALGWRMRLVDTRSATTWWAADELFDTTDPRLVRAARRWEAQSRPRGCRPPDGWLTLHGPHQLARLTAAGLLATLPARCISH